MTIKDFEEKTTNIFKIWLKFNNEVPDIRFDNVSIIFKKRNTDSDQEAVLEKEADTLTEGRLGIAIFELTSEDTAIDPGNYFYEIKWVLPNTVDPLKSSTHILESGRITVKDRLYD